jgi:hypothetical protein
MSVAPSALDAEVVNALEDGRGHRVRKRQTSDEEPEDADAQQQRGKKCGRLAQEAAQLTRDGDVEAGHRCLDAAGQRVRVLAVAPAHGRAGVEIAAAEVAGAEDLDEEGVAPEPQVTRVLDRDEREAVGRGKVFPRMPTTAKSPPRDTEAPARRVPQAAKSARF